MRDGLIYDWDMFEKVWDHAMKSYIKADATDAPVLMSEKSYNPSANRLL